jgi:Domain of unknown function (DUF1906)
MRRVIAVVIVTGLGVLALTAMPSRAADSAAISEVTSRASVVATKTVAYDGLAVTVPATWPVYRLYQSPATCVRYDIHAVYLGVPGVNQQCPAHLVGRTETVSIIPATAGSGAASPVGTRIGSVSAVHAPLMEDAEQQVFRVAADAAGGATVIATYGDRPAQAEQVLTTLRKVAAGDGRKDVAATVRQAAAARPPPTTSSWRGVPSSWPAQLIAQPPPPPPKPRPHPVYGFDACAAPSLGAMHTWRRGYSVVGIYIGGVNAACGLGNLSASWIRSAAKMGWSMLPTYVGPQAACWTGGIGVLIDAKHAAAEGRAAANDAISDLASLGLGKGTPVYYDMEAYHQQNAGCVSAVLTFLGAWSRQIAARGYVSGVYSSQDSGIADMEAAAAEHRPGFTPPTAIWIALWDKRRTLSDGKLVWPFTERTKQYIGPHLHTVGGITLDIDTDWVDSPVARLADSGSRSRLAAHKLMLSPGTAPTAPADRQPDGEPDGPTQRPP